MVLLPYLTADLPGIGGRLRASPDDFVVDELPAYEPSGVGEHVFVRIEKRGINTSEAVSRLARGLGLRERDVGVAGLKDRHAVTRQWLSLPGPCDPDKAAAFVDEQGEFRVLEAKRHGNKLRTGHLRGNHFRLRVRDVDGDPTTALERANAIAARLAQAPGAPNWYGEQRFGRDGDNAIVGRQLVLGERALARNRDRRDQRYQRLMISALQSEMFNAWLTRRLLDGHYAEVLAGDLLHKVPGGLFDSTEPEVDGPRLLAGEVVITGPMFGASMRAPVAGSAAALREQAELTAANLSVEDFARVSSIAEGTRRDASIQLGDVLVSLVSDDQTAIDVSFTLPAGAYATVVMREIMKLAPVEAPITDAPADETADA